MITLLVYIIVGLLLWIVVSLDKDAGAYIKEEFTPIEIVICVILWLPFLLYFIWEDRKID
jgi:hypothetical protein